MIYSLLRPLIFLLDAEAAHRLTVRVLARGPAPRPRPSDARLARHLLGLDFPNPLGLAAGFDKNGEVTDAALGLGFGFVEVGTVTPRPQAGNPRPRVFRLPRNRAVINRLGFNNDGFDVVARRLAPRRGRGIVGVNVGPNRDSADRAADYVAGVSRFAAVADYLAVNVSSPNTPGLRDLQASAALSDLLARLARARDAAARRIPILVKIAPDLDAAALAATVETSLSVGIDGMIVANTTVTRDGLTDRDRAGESGGLSGRPLFHRSTVALAKVRRLAGNDLVLVGVGGIDSAATAWDKITAGADLVQLYTGMIYEGPGLARRIVTGLAERLDREGVVSIAEVVGREADRWAGLDA